MKAQVVLSRLQKVRSEGQDRWKACCPAHDDGTPSLSIRALDDGRVLLHCFAGCEVEAILSALSLQFSDLYPDQLLGHGLKGARSRLSAHRKRLRSWPKNRCWLPFLPPIRLKASY